MRDLVVGGSVLLASTFEGERAMVIVEFTFPFRMGWVVPHDYAISKRFLSDLQLFMVSALMHLMERNLDSICW